MTLIKTAVGIFTSTLACLSLQAQHVSITTIDRIFPSGSPIPESRWTLSFNPLGLLEPPAAIGMGIGYRLNHRVELWSETSFLTNGFMQTEGPLTGIRQVLQAKYFTDGGRFFVAAEVRYKSYQYRDKLDFVNPDTHDTLFNFSNFSRHYFFGVGLQVGWRTKLSTNGRLQMELTTGLGARIMPRVVRQDVLPGYEYRRFYLLEFALADGNNEFTPFYFPGSLRIIYLFGKRLRP